MSKSTIEKKAKMDFERWVAGMSRWHKLTEAQIKRARPNMIRMFRIRARMYEEMHGGPK